MEDFGERMKPFERVQLAKIQPGQSRSGRAGSESCLASGDRRKRSVDSEEVGREGSAPKSTPMRKPRPFNWPKAESGQPLKQGGREPPESLARGTLSKGFSRNLGKPLRFLDRGSWWSRATRDC